MDSFKGENRKFAYNIYIYGYAFNKRMQKAKREKTKPTLPDQHKFEHPLVAEQRMECLLTTRANTGEFLQISTADYWNMAQMQRQMQ